MRIQCPIKINAFRHGSRQAIISDNQTLTYRAFDYRIDSCAQKLRAIGVKERERVCILCAESPEYIILLFALWRLGAVACLLSQRLPPDALKRQIKNVRGKIILTDNVKACKNLAPIIVSLESVVKKSAPKTLSYAVGYRFNQPVTILSTSGSSAVPKAVQHSFANHYYSALGSNQNIPVAASSRWLLSVPLYHVSGLSILFRCFLKGAGVVFSRNKDICSIIKRHRLTHVSFVAAQLQRALARKGGCGALKKLKALLVGGSAIPEQLIMEGRMKKLRLYLSYGLTEMSSQVATTVALNRKGASLKAKVLRYRKVCIAKDGEILVRGKTLFQGYVKKDALRPATGKDGWFHTGDIGSLGKGGFLTVKGRKDAMFISGGENIFPEEIEYFLRGCALVEDALVVAHPNQEYGFRPVAFIKTKKNKCLNPLALEKYLSKFLPKFKIPDAFYLLPKELASIGIKSNRSSLLG
ncbi:MAG: o-succinylbenzoate--CoA ligase [Candidatus Omnitrophota bacterium]